MFGFGKRREQRRDQDSSNSAGDPVIAALLIKGTRFDFASFQRKLTADKSLGRLARDWTQSDEILTCYLGDELIALSLMPAPYPRSDLEGPCETSWMWPKETPATSVLAHQTHVLVIAQGGRADAISRRSLLTHVTALAAEMPDVMGIYWPEATLVHYPRIFVEMARKIPLPLYLWVDFRIFRNQDGTCGMFTTGMRPLGQMEFEIPRISMPPGELREWCMNIAMYLLENGHRVKDGDTIGMDASQKIRIRHRPSSFGARGTVLQLQA
jgi:hypothetical protein